MLTEGSMPEIEANRRAWGSLAEDHYRHYRELLLKGEHQLNENIARELGDIRGKDVVHLQCNTGADTVLISRLGAARVLGVDFSPDNIRLARALARDAGANNIEFMESDILKLDAREAGEYDIAFTSEGVLGWLPDLRAWAKTARSLLRDGGRLYVYDSHPFLLMFDEGGLSAQEYTLRYPYFSKTPDMDTSIGGYASAPKTGVNAYFWSHTLSEIINSIISAGMRIEFFNEYPENFYDLGGMRKSAKPGLYEFEHNRDKYPMAFSLMARADA